MRELLDHFCNARVFPDFKGGWIWDCLAELLRRRWKDQPRTDDFLVRFVHLRNHGHRRVLVRGA